MSINWFLWSGQCWIFLIIYSWVGVGGPAFALRLFFLLWKSSPFPLSNAAHPTSNTIVIKACVPAMVRWKVPVIQLLERLGQEIASFSHSFPLASLPKEGVATLWFQVGPLYGLICVSISEQEFEEKSNHGSYCHFLTFWMCAGLLLSGWILGTSPRRSPSQVFWDQSLASYLGNKCAPEIIFWNYWLSQAGSTPCPRNAHQQPLVEDELHEEDKNPAGTSTRLKWQSFLKRDH